MDEDYLRNIQHWLRAELALPRKLVDAVWDAGADIEAAPMIPPPRTPLE
ncbi:hypothetical protein [Amycolatopsis taiwanensis]|uniref:Uncharacterized protein n=1 Tax=Amycolatopsis taiwanensis TaxID=342230 RepID=A0A9W6VE50_9PSEU|nr:hypothetical protein [Amycolatopsis taiwanensis]GLY63429.1 hypothetical protein Atai01_00480 [Amycolatopsis taiwanensis]